MEHGATGERGSASPLLALVVLAAGGLAFGLGRMGGAAVERAQARTAADASALAGAAEGRPAAVAVAASNGGRLTGYEVDGSDVLVSVDLGGASASARARRVGGLGVEGVGTCPGARCSGFQPAMIAAIAQAERLLHQAIPITSGYRSPGAQRSLWERRATNPYPVARPGTSAHERGLAIDVASSFVDRLVAVAPRAGLCQPLPQRDPIHFELCRRTAPP